MISPKIWPCIQYRICIENTWGRKIQGHRTEQRTHCALGTSASFAAAGSSWDDFSVEALNFFFRNSSLLLASKHTFVDLNKYIHCMFVEGKPRTVFFLQTLYFQLRMGESQAKSREPWMCQTCCRTLQKEVLQTCSDLGIHFVVCRFASSVYK